MGSGALPDLGEREAGQGFALTAPTQPLPPCQSWCVTPWGDFALYCLSLCPCLAWVGGVSLGLFLLEVPGPESRFCASTVWLQTGDLAFLGHLRPEGSRCSRELTGEEEPTVRHAHDAARWPKGCSPGTLLGSYLLPLWPLLGPLPAGLPLPFWLSAPACSLLSTCLAPLAPQETGDSPGVAPVLSIPCSWPGRTRPDTQGGVRWSWPARPGWGG